MPRPVRHRYIPARLRNEIIDIRLESSDNASVNDLQNCCRKKYEVIDHVTSELDRSLSSDMLLVCTSYKH